MRLKDEVAIVTGGPHRMGEAEARLFAAEGAKVVVADILPSDAETVAADIRAGDGEATAAEIDVTSEAEWIDLIANEATGTRAVRQRSMSGEHSPVGQHAFSSCLSRSTSQRFAPREANLNAQECDTVLPSRAARKKRDHKGRGVPARAVQL